VVASVADLVARSGAPAVQRALTPIQPPVPTHLRAAVRHMSGDVEQNFQRRLSEDIIPTSQRFCTLGDRRTRLQFKGKAVDIPQVAAN